MWYFFGAFVGMTLALGIILVHHFGECTIIVIIYDVSIH
jgi:nitrate/nitrite transporter NarK